MALLDVSSLSMVFGGLCALDGFDLTVATLKTADAITVGQDILVGSL